MKVDGVAQAFSLHIDRDSLAYRTARWLDRKVADDDEVPNHDLLCLLGRHLYQLLFPVDLDRDPGLLTDSEKHLQDARRQFEQNFPDPLKATGTALRVGLGFEPEASKLAQLPWEFLYRPTRTGGYFLAGRHTELALTRFASAQPESLPTIDGDLTILPVVSNPAIGGLSAIPATLLPDIGALASGVGGVKVLQVARNPRWTQLQERIEKDEPHVVHIVSHGEKNALWFRAAGVGEAMALDASSVADVFGSHTPLLVVLASCESAAGESTNDYWFEESASVIESLVNRGIHAVVAMRYRISAESAKIFTEAFYKAVFSGQRVDQAVEAARAELAGETADRPDKGGTYHTRAFGTPVVYVGGSFELLPLAPSGAGATGPGTAPISTPTSDKCPRCGTPIYPPRQLCLGCGLKFICPRCKVPLPTLVVSEDAYGNKRYTERCGTIECGEVFEQPPWNPAKERAIAG